MKLSQCKSLHDSCIYCITFPNEKKYVGKAIDLAKRVNLYMSAKDKRTKVYEAISEFGVDSLDLKILSSISCGDKIDKDICLSILEIKYIRELNTIYPNGYNVSLGGESLRIPPECITTDKKLIKDYYSSCKIILEYDKDGNFVKEYPSIAQYAYEKGFTQKEVSNSLDKKKILNNSYYLRTRRYDYIPQKIEVPLFEEVKRVKYKDVVEKRKIVKKITIIKNNPIVVYDSEGKFVGEYRNQSDAGIRLLGSTKFPLRKYNRGYIGFKKESNFYPDKIEPKEYFDGKVIEITYKKAEDLDEIPVIDASRKVVFPNFHKKLKLNSEIDQFDLDGNFIARYKSIRDASYETGIRYSQVYACVRGTTRVASGYIFQKAFI